MFAELNLINSGNCIIFTDGHMSEGFPLNFNFPDLDIYNTTVEHYQQWIRGDVMEFAIKNKVFDIHSNNNLPYHCNIQLIDENNERFVVWNIGISSDHNGNLGKIEFHENYIVIFANNKWDDAESVIGSIANWLLRVLIGNNCENIDVRPTLSSYTMQCDEESE